MGKVKMYTTIICDQIEEYRKATKKEKGIILDNLCSVTNRSRDSVSRTLRNCIGYNRYATKKSQNKGNKKPLRRRKPGRPLKYSKEIDAALEYIWKAYNYPCAERLKEVIPEAIKIFKRDKEWKCTSSTDQLLLDMSLGSIKLRTVSMSKKNGIIRGFSTTRSAGLLKDIPIFCGDWSTKSAGYGQIDTVVHSGPKLEGAMVYTVNFVDIATYWQEPVAQLNKGEKATLKSIMLIEKRLPFKLRGLHPDSGSEFINYSLYNVCKKRNIELTRSRPSKKNDNCYIEQRNNATIRYYVGYERYDCQEAVDAMNELYKVIRLYINFFQPTYKLIKKERLPNGKYKRIYDTPCTPYQRVLRLNEAICSKKQKEILTKQYQQLNPRELLAKIKALTIKLQKIQRELGYHF